MFVDFQWIRNWSVLRCGCCSTSFGSWSTATFDHDAFLSEFKRSGTFNVGTNCTPICFGTTNLKRVCIRHVWHMCTANPMASIESFNEKVEVILEIFLGSNNISSDLKLQALVPWGVQFAIIWSVRRKREEICIFTCCFGAQKQQSCLKVLSTPKVTGTFWTNFMILRDMTCG